MVPNEDDVREADDFSTAPVPHTPLSEPDDAVEDVPEDETSEDEDLGEIVPSDEDLGEQADELEAGVDPDDRS